MMNCNGSFTKNVINTVTDDDTLYEKIERLKSQIYEMSDSE